MPWVACLDASVLIPFPTADILIGFAEVGIYRPVWGRTVLDETERNLVKRLGKTRAQAASRLAAMKAAFPSALVATPSPLPPMPADVNAKDRHVVATAIGAKANVIVTNNVRHFAKRNLARDYDILVQTADQFVSDQWQINRRSAADALILQLGALRNPPRTLDEHIDACRAARLRTFAECLDRDRRLIVLR
jgi:hypothetical protein